MSQDASAAYCPNCKTAQQLRRFRNGAIVCMKCGTTFREPKIEKPALSQAERLRAVYLEAFEKSSLEICERKWESGLTLSDATWREAQDIAIEAVRLNVTASLQKVAIPEGAIAIRIISENETRDFFIDAKQMAGLPTVEDKLNFIRGEFEFFSQDMATGLNPSPIFKPLLVAGTDTETVAGRPL